MTNFDAADKSKLETAVNDAIKWLDTSQEVSKEEYEEKQKELEAVYNLNLLRSSFSPIMRTIYGAAVVLEVFTYTGIPSVMTSWCSFVIPYHLDFLTSLYHRSCACEDMDNVKRG